MTEEELCSHCGIGHVRPMHFSMEEAIVICDNHECDHLLTTIPSEKIIKCTLFAPTLPFQIGVRERYGSSNSSSSGFVSEIRSPLLSPAPSTTTSLTDKEVELLFNPSFVKKDQPEKKKVYLESSLPVEKLQGCKMLSEKCKTESFNDTNTSTIEIINSKLFGRSNSHSVKNQSSDTNKNHGNHEFLKALDKLELKDIENNSNIGGSKSGLKIISNSCRKKNDYNSLVIPSYSSAFSQVSPHKDINCIKNSCNMSNISIKQEVSNEVTDLFPHPSNASSFFSPVSSDDSGYTEEITNKQEIKTLLENKEINLNKDLTKICLEKILPSSHYENVVKDLIKPSFPLAAVNISVHPAVISYDKNSISTFDRNTNNEDSSTSDDANILMPSASRIILQNDSQLGSQFDKDSSREKKILDESLINQLDIILENDISHAELKDLKVNTYENVMSVNSSENRNITSEEHNPQGVNSEGIPSTINSPEKPFDSHYVDFNPNIKTPIQGSVLINPISPFNYSDRTSTACSPNSFDQPSENDNFSDKASVEGNVSDNSISSYGSFGHHHSYFTDQDSSVIRKGEGRVENYPSNKKKNKGKGRGRRMNMIKENNLQNFDGLSGPSAVIPSKRSKILNVPEPVRVSQRSKQNIEFQATRFASHVSEEENAVNLPSTSLSVRNVRRGLASLVHGPDYGSVNSLINSTAHRLSSMSYRSTPSGSFKSDPWSVLEMHVEQIDVEVVLGPKAVDQQGNDSTSQHAKTTINNEINGTSTWSGLSNIQNKKVEDNFGDIPNLISKVNSEVKQHSNFEIGSSKANIKEKPKSQENEIDDAKPPSACKDNPTIIFSTLKELHQMNATKMFENKFTVTNKRDLIEGKENKNSVTNPLFKCESVNVFTKGSKIWSSSYDNCKSTSSTNTHSNNSFTPRISQPEKLSTSCSQYPLLVSPDSRFIRSWVGNLEGYKHEENEIKTKSEILDKNSVDINEKLDPIKYFNALLRDVSFEDRFFQCPTSESLQTTFEEHLNSSLFFGETAESRSPSENIEIRDIESETDLSPSVLKILDEVMNDSLESDTQKNSKKTEFDWQYHICPKNNLSMNSNALDKFCISDGRYLNSVKEESNELFSQTCIMFGPSKYTHCKKCESPIKLNSPKNNKESQPPNNIDDSQIHDLSLSVKQCSVAQGRSESSPIKDSISSITNSNDVEINMIKKQNKSEQKNKTDINEINELQNDAPKPCIKIKLIKSQVDPTDKNSIHTWLSDPSYICNLDPRENISEVKLDENEAGKSLDSESIMSFKDLLPAPSKKFGTTSNTLLLKNIDEKEPDVSLQYENNNLDLPTFSKKCVTGIQKLEDEVDSDSNPGHILNITASSDSLHLNLPEDELDDNCPVIAINSDDEVEVLNDGSKGGNIDQINEIDEGKNQSHLIPFSTEMYPLKCNSPETQDLYTLLSSGLEKSETKGKEKVKDEAMDNNKSINSSCIDFNRDSESNFNSASQQQPKLYDHDEVCCGILDNSISHNSLCRSPCLKEFVDFSFCMRNDSNRQVYLPKSVRKKKTENVTSEKKTNFDIPKPQSPNEISLLILQEKEQSHSLTITPNKVLFGCTKSGPQHDDFYNSQKSDDSGPGFLEMSFPDQMTMWQNTMYVDEKAGDKNQNSNYLEVTHLKNNSLPDTTEIGLSAYESEIDTINPTSGLESESCVYDASDEDNMESDWQSNYDSRTIQTVKRECLSRDENPLMVQIKNENNEVLKRIPCLLTSKNEIMPEALRRNLLSVPSISCQRDLHSNCPSEDVDSKQNQSINYHKKTVSCKSLPLTSGDHEISKNVTNLKENQINNALTNSKMSKSTQHISYSVQEHELNNKPPNNCIISLLNKKENTNTIHNNSQGVFDFLSDAYSQNKNMYKVINSQLRSKSEKLLSTDIESDESCDSIDCKQPRGRKSFTLIPPVLKRSYDSQVSNSLILSKPSGLHSYSTSPRKKSLNKLWEKWASKNALEECNSQSEETEQVFDTSYRTTSPNHILGSHSRKRKMALEDKDNSFMSDKKYHKIIYSYKKGGFVCRPTSQMLRKISELRKKEEENKIQFEKQNQEDDVRHQISKERENILRMTRDNLIDRRKKMKAFRMQRITSIDTKTHLEELTLQYKARRDKDKEIQRRTLETVNQVKEKSSEKNEVPENIIVMVDGKMHLYHRDPYKK